MATKLEFGDVKADTAVQGNAHVGVTRSTLRTVSKGDDPVAKPSPTGQKGKHGRMRAFSKASISAAARRARG